MNYFNNYPYSIDSLKKEFRAYCQTLHPDHGGNEEDFKTMMAEYSQVIKDLNGTHAKTRSTMADDLRRAAQEAARRYQEQQEAERKAREEERKRREEEARREAEELAKAQEATRRMVDEWATRLERIQENMKVGRRAYGFDDRKAAAAYMATTKRNIKKIFNYFFPGVKVSVKLSGQVWQEEFKIEWEDGPSVYQVRTKCGNLFQMFVPSHVESNPYEDYCSYQENKFSTPWRDAFGGAFGDCYDFELQRSLSEEGREQAQTLAGSIFANWTNEAPKNDEIKIDLNEFENLCRACGAPLDQWGGIDNNTFGYRFSSYTHNPDGSTGAAYYSALWRMLREIAPVTNHPKEKKPEFVPTYGPAYKAIKKALGQNVFYYENDKKENIEMNIFEAAEMIKKNEWEFNPFVKIGRIYTNYEGEKNIYETNCGGEKTQQKRIEKFTSAGITLNIYPWSTTHVITVQSITAATLDALRAEAADIERQRQAWQKAQEAKNAPKQDTTTQNTTSEETTTNEAPADGLELVDIPGGVAVTGDSRNTFRNRRAIKAHGAKWNKEAGQWQATDPESVQSLRDWFNLRAQDPERPDPDPQQPNPEPTTQDTTTETAQDPQQTTTEAAQATEQPTAEDTATETAQEPEQTTQEAAQADTNPQQDNGQDYSSTHHGAKLSDWERKNTPPVDWCQPGQCFECSTAAGPITGIITKLGLDCFFYVATFSTRECLIAYRGFLWEKLRPVTIEDETDPNFAQMFKHFHRIRQQWETTTRQQWESQTKAQEQPTQEDTTTEAAKDPQQTTTEAAQAPGHPTTEDTTTETAQEPEQPAQEAAQAAPASDLENLFGLFEHFINKAVYTGADFTRESPEIMQRGYYYKNGRINDLFLAFRLGHQLH